MKPFIWIIDEEWPDYAVEEAVLKEAFPECTIRISGYEYRADLEAFGKDADAILSQIYVKLDDEALSKLHRCKVISVFGGGYDRVDVASAMRRGIKVTFVPGYCVDDVSDYVIAAIFHVNKRIDSYRDAMHSGLWGVPAMKELPHRVRGSNLFVIGLGRIGRATAKKAGLLGMNISAYDPYVDEETMASLGVRKTDLYSGLAAADFVTIHAKLTEETDSMIGERELACMKQSAFLINTARGKIVKVDDLIRAVTEGSIAGAVVDVVPVEPPTFREAIFTCPGIVITPHVSYLSQESFFELKSRTAGNAVKVLRGEPVDDIAEP
ncbi:C-terminal binding protein [Aminiphilus circumscriptus]|jgi:D-3-phosphoglycerate dehydrogenase|uniref:C-terminal binding protein n=1 Tax=Aminiphilus circumscriptus TaxID=290732 RepID=UPI00047852A3|nr:C-terminal binding protein [Aminiphilus circumscriptus]